MKIDIFSLDNKGFHADEVKHCKGILSKCRGLMFSKKRAVLFEFDQERIIRLHMIGVFFPIDVVVLDHSKRIIQVKKRLRPFEFFSSSDKARYCIEIPSSWNLTEHISDSDVLSWSPARKI